MGRDTDEFFLARALELAARGRGAVEPNPLVGCVLVKDELVIGEGFHRAFGAPHAEVEALAACTESPEGATAYVNLEPCSHTNKKTPPCAPRLIAAGIQRVVIGWEDPNPAVSGRGIQQLRAAGIEVVVGVRGAESRQLNAPFFSRQLRGRPYVTLKWAESANGKAAGQDGQPFPISNERSHRVVHALRARCDAILVGINTVLRDDPLLTARGLPEESRRTLRRIVLDSRARIPTDSRLVTTAGQVPLHVFVGRWAKDDPAMSRRVDMLRERGVQVEPIDCDPGAALAINSILQKLAAELDVTHLLVEGGPTIHAAFVRQNLADRVWVFRSPQTVNEPRALMAAAIPAGYTRTGIKSLDEDTLSEYLNPDSAVYFSKVPSIDLTASLRWVHDFAASATSNPLAGDLRARK